MKNLRAQDSYLKEQAQKLDEFYRLHYPQKKLKDIKNKLRAKSVISVADRHNPELTPKLHKANKKHSQLNKSLNKSRKSKAEQHREEPFSFKSVLGSSNCAGTIYQYFQKHTPRQFDTIEDLSRKNTWIRQAWTRCNQEKSKIAKVLGSQRQSQETKSDYLQLKKQELEEDKLRQSKQIYDQFFKKQYESIYGQKGFEEFVNKLQQVIGIVHKKLFKR